MKKLLGLVLAVCLLASVMVMPVMARADLPFKDVKKTDWFYDDVDSAWMMGLINGKTEDMFMPDDNMTYAEAVKLAACMNQYYVEGKVTLKVSGDPWYDSYVEYCNDNGIIKKGYSWDKLATRAGYMEIFANSLPEEALKPINYIEDGSIPDVKSSAEYYDAVYKLYRAGILTGVDKDHNCNPAANIKRSEVAAILTRMMNDDARKEFTMGDPENAGKDSDKDNDKDKDTDKDKDPEKDPEKGDDEEEELVVTADPETVEVEPGIDYTLQAVVEGGKAPYTYEWKGRRINVHKSTWYAEIDDQAAIDAGFNVVDYDNEAGAMTFYADGNKAIAAFPVIYCIVTDADGNQATAEFRLTYVGSGAVNDLSSDDFLMYVEDIFWIEGRGLIATGRVENGKVTVGDTIRLAKLDGSYVDVDVEGIEMFRKMMDEAEKGDNVGILLSGLGETSEAARANINRGEALISDNVDLTSANAFYAKVKVLTKEEGGRTNKMAGDGSYKPQCYIGSTDSTCVVYNDVYNEEEDCWESEDLVPGETYEDVWIEMAFDDVFRFMYLGQEGALREGGRTIATFEITQVVPADWFGEEE
ncbi:MAG: S-layer homology domain-containing protein [Clostridia bacterium]|nr:S-layer homology domain-containing protein [Clostridia bacterium]